MLFLGGGGSADDERALWLEAFPDGSRILVLPFAQAGAERQRSTIDWFCSAVAALGSFDTVGWVDGDARIENLHEADALVIPGGNTFLLLSELRRLELPPVIAAFEARGGSVYGGSAGAALMGADIDIALIADANEVGLEDTRGLDLLRGADALPHYTADQAGFARDRARERRRPIIGIPEDAGVVVDGSTARNVGPRAVSVVTAAGATEIPADGTWTLASDRIPPR